MLRVDRYELLDGQSEQRLDRELKVSTLVPMIVLIVATVAVMAIRQLGAPSWGWHFDSSEFGAIGQSFSGLASAIALWSAVTLVLNDRRRQSVRDRFAAARSVRYAYRDAPHPHWVVHNGSSRLVHLVKVGGHPELADRSIHPGDDIRIKDATLIATAGYRGDQPVGVLRFSDGDYVWTNVDSLLKGERIP